MKSNLPNQRAFASIDSSAGGIFRAALFVIYTIFFTLNLTAAAQAVVPVTGTPPVLTPVTINDGPGDQYDPHVSGDLAAYSSDLAIRYYKFSTAVDAQIPTGTSVRDLLSDVSGSKIVFSRISGVGTSVMVFDAVSAAAPIEIDPAAGTNRLSSAIGGNTVAYIDFGIEANGELIIHDLATAASVRITSDTLRDRMPSVSPDGAVVTWEHCPGGSCDIWQAVKTGLGWSVGIVANSVDPESNPDTNGTPVVCDARRGGSADVFWRPVAGGAEVQLQFAGFERNPSIAGSLLLISAHISEV